MLNAFGTPKLKTSYIVECWSHYHFSFCGLKLLKRKTPKLKWREEWQNLVVTAGLNKILDASFKTGLTTPAWYVGLKGTGTVVVGDTMGSHAGWAELTPYSNANRPTWTPGSVAGASVDNSAARAVFNINATSTIYGCFLSDSNTKGGTTGTLYGAGDFAASRPVINGDTLNVTVTITQS